MFPPVIRSRSLRLRAMACTRTRTSPGPGTGSGTSSSCSASSGGPYWWVRQARMVAGTESGAVCWSLVIGAAPGLRGGRTIAAVGSRRRGTRPGCRPLQTGARMAIERLDRDRLIAESIELAGSDDFGAPTWQEGLDILLDDFQQEARLTDLGVEVAAGAVTDYLTARLGITAFRAANPEVAEGRVDHPIFIVGQPRTGTTILY